jgi:hypothetical protein
MLIECVLIQDLVAGCQSQVLYSGPDTIEQPLKVWSMNVTE